MDRVAQILPQPRRYFKTIFISLSALFLTANPATAQLIPDNTLGSESSRVVPVSPIRDNIEGGARRGTNLFHSFREFNVSPNREIYFNNPSGIQNIINRVTGGNISEIFGTLGVSGNANLYLINPNGIVFGDGARLDINGTFIGTTADGVRLGTNDVYSATNPASSSLLTIRPEALFINRLGATQRAIVNRANLRSTNPGSNVTLSADTINNFGTITAPGANISLEATNGDINTSNINTIDSINGGGNIAISATGNITLNGTIDASGGNFTVDERGLATQVSNSSANSGNIKLEAGNNIIFNSNANVFAIGDLGGSFNIKAQNSIFGNNAEIRSISIGNIAGKGGDIALRAKSIDLNQIIIDSTTQGLADTGNINVDTNFLRLVDGAQINTNVDAAGNGSNLTVSAVNIEIIGTNPDRIRFPSGLFAQTRGSGNGGNINIDTNTLRLVDGGQVSLSTFGVGNAGDLTLSATEIEVIGVNPLTFTQPSGIFTSTERGQGNGANVTINTDLLRLQDGAQIFSGTLTEGNGGNLNITANKIELIGTNPFLNARSSGLFSSTERGQGNGGSININTNLLRLQDGAAVFTGSLRGGESGNLNISAVDIEIIGINPFLDRVSALSAQSDNGTKGGNITINTDRLRLVDGGQINTITFIRGNGGDLTITANEIEIIGTNPRNGFRSALLSSAIDRSTGNGGNITIDTKDLKIADGAIIDSSNFDSSNRLSPGLGRTGNITIAAETVVLDRGGITANGNIQGGGEIRIDSSNFLSLHDRSQITSDVGETRDFPGGNITINTPIILATPDNNQITARAVTSAGGNININTNAIFGLPQFLRIDADSDLGIDGTIAINGLSDEISKGTLLTPNPTLNAEAILANDICAVQDGEIAGGSSFTIIGKGGMTPNPLENVDRNRNLVEWSKRPDSEAKINSNLNNNSPQKPQFKKRFKPAVGWYRRTDGTVVLTDNPALVRSLNKPIDYPDNCQK